MDLLVAMGVSPLASSDVVFYPVSLTSATGRDVYAELTELGITIPAPQPIPKDATQFIGLKYLESCWMEAAKWVSLTEDKRRHGPQSWRTFLSKEKNRDAMFAAVEALQELREKGSSLSPVLWCWWRLTQMLEKGDPPFFFYSIWSASALRSPKMRRWYYEEVSADFLCRKKLWPTQVIKAFAIVREYLDQASLIPTKAAQSELWSKQYAERYDHLLQSGGFVKTAAEAKLSSRVAANDLGIWLSANLIDYLKLADVGLSMTQAPTPLTTTVRRRKAKAGG